MSSNYHLAQVNIAKARAPLDHPVMKGFVDQLDHINRLAESSPGFVWRLQTDEGDATAIRAFDDPLIIVNLSLWESVEALREYVYGGEHLAVLRQKRDWMEKLPTPSLALWWLPAGELPDVRMARRKLELLQAQGASPEVFTFARPFPMPGRVGEPA
ncbi:DUF3291 domain-containing protein [Pseudomonas sp. LA21]|uniref:DUF3291 domain-containing protein n=1 Tax=unclassified Pseudomonas TaxID=196821 RepID=UPI001A9DCBF5|nr:MULTISPECIES: DUF3291 domain-containing protein [unclassified Pseudomonas]MCJ1884377.1 DUF3291 domain-containing protein [Pseudomonas sp. LA21]